MKRPETLVGPVLNPLPLFSAVFSPRNLSALSSPFGHARIPMPLLLFLLPERFLGSFGSLLHERVAFMVGANEAMKRSVNSLLNNPNLPAEVQKLEKGRVLASIFSEGFCRQFNLGPVLAVAPAQMMLSYAIADSQAYSRVSSQALQRSADSLFDAVASGDQGPQPGTAVKAGAGARKFSVSHSPLVTAKMPPDSPIISQPPAFENPMSARDSNSEVPWSPAREAAAEAAMAQFIGTCLLHRALLDVTVSRDSFSFGARVRAVKAKKEMLELLMSQSRRRKLPPPKAKALALLFARVAKRIFK